MVSELQPQIDEWIPHLKCQSVLWATIAIEIYKHSVHVIYTWLMGSTAVVVIHHRTPYVHLSMSYSGFSPALSLSYRILYFSELSRPVSSSMQQGQRNGMSSYVVRAGTSYCWSNYYQTGRLRQAGADGPKLLAEQARFKESGVGRWETCLRLLFHANGGTIQVPTET